MRREVKAIFFLWSSSLFLIIAHLNWLIWRSRDVSSREVTDSSSFCQIIIMASLQKSDQLPLFAIDLTLIIPWSLVSQTSKVEISLHESLKKMNRRREEVRLLRWWRRIKRKRLIISSSRQVLLSRLLHAIEFLTWSFSWLQEKTPTAPDFSEITFLVVYDEQRTLRGLFSFSCEKVLSCCPCARESRKEEPTLYTCTFSDTRFMMCVGVSFLQVFRVWIFFSFYAHFSQIYINDHITNRVCMFLRNEKRIYIHSRCPFERSFQAILNLNNQEALFLWKDIFAEIRSLLDVIVGLCLLSRHGDLFTTRRLAREYDSRRYMFTSQVSLLYTRKIQHDDLQSRILSLYGFNTKALRFRDLPSSFVSESESIFERWYPLIASRVDWSLVVDAVDVFWHKWLLFR